MLGRRPSLRACLVAAALLPAACTTTVDSIGYNGVGSVHLRPLPDHPPPPNKLREAGKTDADIASRIAATFNSLFYGDPNTQAIYFPMGSDQANIQDILHNREVRTEGIGLGRVTPIIKEACGRTRTTCFVTRPRPAPATSRRAATP